MRLLAVSVMHARFASWQPAWERKKPYIWLDGECCQFFQLGYTFFAFGWNGYRYHLTYDGYWDDVTIVPQNAPSLPPSFEIQIVHLARLLWKAIPPRIRIFVPGDAEYDIDMGMENPMNKPNRMPKDFVARELVLERQRLENAGQESHHITKQLSERGKRGARKRNLLAELKEAKKAEPISELHFMLGAQGETPQQSRARLEAEARKMAFERGDHLLPEEEHPAG